MVDYEKQRPTIKLGAGIVPSTRPVAGIVPSTHPSIVPSTHPVPDAQDAREEHDERAYLDAQSGGLVSQLLLHSAREREAMHESLTRSAEQDARTIAQAFVRLYERIASDLNLPRYVEEWMYDAGKALDTAYRVIGD